MECTKPVMGLALKMKQRPFIEILVKNGARMGIRTSYLHPSRIDHRKPLDCIRLSNIAWYW